MPKDFAHQRDRHSGLLKARPRDRQGALISIAAIAVIVSVILAVAGLVSWLLHRAKSAKHPGQWDVLPRTGTASPGLNNDVRSRTALTSAEIFSSV